MHQQNQHIIHVISYDNAQSTKIERPALLSLHLKLHWNCNQQLLQSKGRENKRKQKKKKKLHGVLLWPSEEPSSSFFLAPWTSAPVWSLEPGFAEFWSLYQTTLLFQCCTWSCKPGARQDPSAGSTQLPRIHCSPSLSCLSFLHIETSHEESQNWTLHRSIGGDQEGLAWEGGIRACLG